MKPAGFGFGVRIEAEGFYGPALIAIQSFRELVGYGGGAGSAEGDEVGSVVEFGGEIIRGLAGEEGHGAGAL
jgi:hypothetical protein